MIKFSANIQLAVESKNYEKINIILNECDKFGRRHLLLESISNPDYEVFEYVAKRIDIDERCDRYGRTFFMELINKKENFTSTEQVEMWLKYTKDINLTDLDGLTALDHYFQNYHNIGDIFIRILTLFLKHGANPFIVNEDGRNSIDLFLHNNSDIDVLDYMIENVKPEFINIDVITLLYVLQVTSKENYNYVELLLPYVNDINEIDDDDHNILWHVQNKEFDNKFDIIELLIANGARV